MMCVVTKTKRKNNADPGLFPESKEEWDKILKRATPLTEADAKLMDKESIEEIRARAATLVFYNELQDGKNLVEASAKAEEVRKAKIPNPEVYMERFRRSRTEKS
jgi:hypothetical protein